MTDLFVSYTGMRGNNRIFDSIVVPMNGQEDMPPLWYAPDATCRLVREIDIFRLAEWIGKWEGSAVKGIRILYWRRMEEAVENG